MKNELVVDNLNYGILHDIDLALTESSVNALIGNSASGKTTLLKCIAGIPRNFNNIKLKGNVIPKSNLGVFLGLANLSRKPVLENIMEPLLNIGVSHLKAKNKVYKSTKKLEIENLVYRKIEELSYSEKIMVAFCKSIINDPNIILLDNLFDSLDQKYKQNVINYLEDLKEKNNAIIIYTTNNSEDLINADSIIVLKKGNIVAIDKKNKIFENEEILTKNGYKAPFIIDLSYKLKAYELIDDIFYDSKKLIGELWK